MHANFDYTVNPHGVTITKYKGDPVKGSYVVIPNEIENKPVTEIAAEAFSNKSWIISVMIPDSVTKIGDNAFSFCHSLSEATIRKVQQLNQKAVL